MKFEKYHGLGNDFIIFQEKDLIDITDYQELAKKVCHRKFGIGADGMIVVAKSDKAPVFMKFYNADGSIAPMCGNGIRCFTHYIVNNQLVTDKTFKVDTLAGVLEVTWDNNEQFMVRVYMGEPDFMPKNVPVLTNKEKYINETFDLIVVDLVDDLATDEDNIYMSRLWDRLRDGGVMIGYGGTSMKDFVENCSLLLFDNSNIVLEERHYPSWATEDSPTDKGIVYGITKK